MSHQEVADYPVTKTSFTKPPEGSSSNAVWYQEDPIQSSEHVRPTHLSFEKQTSTTSSKSAPSIYSNDVFTSESSGYGSTSSAEVPTIVYRRPTTQSKMIKRKVISAVNPHEMEDYCNSLSPNLLSASSPDVNAECKSPRVARIKPVKRKESLRTDRPQSWTPLRSFTSFSSLFKIRLPTSLEDVTSGTKSFHGNFVYEFEGMFVFYELYMYCVYCRYSPDRETRSEYLQQEAEQAPSGEAVVVCCKEQ